MPCWEFSALLYISHYCPIHFNFHNLLQHHWWWPCFYFTVCNCNPIESTIWNELQKALSLPGEKNNCYRYIFGKAYSIFHKRPRIQLALIICVFSSHGFDSTWVPTLHLEGFKDFPDTTRKVFCHRRRCWEGIFTGRLRQPSHTLEHLLNMTRKHLSWREGLAGSIIHRYDIHGDSSNKSPMDTEGQLCVLFHTLEFRFMYYTGYLVHGLSYVFVVAAPLESCMECKESTKE